MPVLDAQKTVTKLNDAWIDAGQKVSDLNNKLTGALLDDSITDEEMAKLKNERDHAATRRDGLKDQLETAREEANVEAKALAAKNAEPKPLTPAEEDKKNTFIKNFVGMMKGDPKMLNLASSNTDESGNAIGLTIPVDVQTAIHELVRQYDSLQELVNVESVTTQNGSRVYEKWSDVTPLKSLDDEDATISDNDDPALHLIKYLIKRYAGITTMTNSLLKDTAENIQAWLTKWVAKKVVVTRNAGIIAKIETLPNSVSPKTFDDVMGLSLDGVDPALLATSGYLTNSAGFKALALVKDAMGNYLMTRDPTQPRQRLINGYPVIVIGNRWLKAKTDGSYPIGFGNLREAITLFDREQMSLLATNIGAGAFEKDQTKLRVIDRFDVAVTDDEAFVYGEFTGISDQTANFAAGDANPKA